MKEEFNKDIEIMKKTTCNSGKEKLKANQKKTQLTDSPVDTILGLEYKVAILEHVDEDEDKKKSTNETFKTSETPLKDQTNKSQL
jgi:hypothetical protein